MVLRVHNAYHTEVWVAYLYPSTFCSQNHGTSWAKAGWWHLNPNETKIVLGGDLSSKWMYYIHAHSSDGTEWGSYTYEYCPSQRFDWCTNISSNTSIKRNFDEVYSNKPDKTINLVG
jgi:uncharacterized membrane protein